MVNSNFSQHEEKKAVIISCFGVLKKINVFDFSNEDAKEKANKALQLIEQYPNLKNIKKQVRKYYTADYYVAIAHTHLLGVSLSGEASQTSLDIIKESLGNALQIIQSDLNK